MRGKGLSAAPARAWLERDHALLTGAVGEAGPVAMRFFRAPVAKWEKRPGDPVSEADHAVNDFLKHRLLGARPGYGWISEESEDDPARREAERVWVVDPIDGTRAYLKGRPEFAISAALVAEGRPVAAAVFNPATGELFEAWAGGGARLGGEPLRASDPARLDGLRLLASRRTFETHRWVRSLPGAKLSAVNSIAYRLALVASGRFDATISLSPKSDWDIAAADLLVHEAGGRCTAADGRGFVYNREQLRHPSVIAAGPALHARLMEVVGGK